MFMVARHLIAALLVLTTAALARAEVKTKLISYQYGGVTFKGHLAWDDAVKEKRPGVLVLHEWWGLNDYARKRTEQLAGLGYVAFAADMYGEGKTTEHPKEAGQFATEVRSNVAVWQGRAKAALEVLVSQPQVDATRLAAIGYCFGGSTALELAYTGADLKAVATFHAALPVPDATQAKAIRAKVLINHGAADKFIPEETAIKFRAALEEAKVDYTMVYHGGAVHSFTVQGIEQKNVPGLAYNAEADRRSWEYMMLLFREAFAEKR
jgi:dienelactone hydrolase